MNITTRKETELIAGGVALGAAGGLLFALHRLQRRRWLTAGEGDWFTGSVGVSAHGAPPLPYGPSGFPLDVRFQPRHDPSTNLGL